MKPDDLEPGVIDTLRDVDVNYLDPAHAQAASTLSLAISMKRIADAMTKTAEDKSFGFWDILQVYGYNNA